MTAQRCPECKTGAVVLDHLERGYQLAHCSVRCGWSA